MATSKAAAAAAATTAAPRIEEMRDGRLLVTYASGAMEAFAPRVGTERGVFVRWKGRYYVRVAGSDQTDAARA